MLSKAWRRKSNENLPGRRISLAELSSAGGQAGKLTKQTEPEERSQKRQMRNEMVRKRNKLNSAFAFLQALRKPGSRHKKWHVEPNKPLKTKHRAWVQHSEPRNRTALMVSTRLSCPAFELGQCYSSTYSAAAGSEHARFAPALFSSFHQ